MRVSQLLWATFIKTTQSIREKIMLSNQSIALSELKANSMVRVIRLCGSDASVNQKLQDLGFFRGTVVKVLGNDAGMPMLLAIGDGRAALSKELAAQVKVNIIS